MEDKGPPPPTTNMGYAEQRRHERVSVGVAIFWGMTPACPREGRVNSLSLGGCFLETGEDVPVGEEVFVNLRLRAAATLAGEVRYRLEGSGVGIEFKGAGPEVEGLLAGMVEFYSKARDQ